MGQRAFDACNGFDCALINTDVSQRNCQLGPRVSVSVGKLGPFAQILMGASPANVRPLGSDTCFATGVAGGLDHRLAKLIAWRFQADYIHHNLFGTRPNNVRLSTGIAVRF